MDAHLDVKCDRVISEQRLRFMDLELDYLIKRNDTDILGEFLASVGSMH